MSAPKDPLGFVDKRPYADRLKEEQARTGMREACIVGRGYLRGRPLVFGVTDSAFIMGSMGSVVGEKLTRADRSRNRAQPAALWSSAPRAAVHGCMRGSCP